MRTWSTPFALAGLCLGVGLLAPACTPKPPPKSAVTPQLAQASETENALEILDELETLIETGGDTEEDRAFAYDRIGKVPDDKTAGWAFARAAVAGRLAELRGAGAGKLVTEAESHARTSVERDPAFRDGAARRMLGTLYVMAPPRLVEHGDAEVGLEMLEAMVAEAPDNVRNHLRLAEAFINLGDPEPALPSLCTVRAGADQLRADEQKLLGQLIEGVGGDDVLACEQAPA